MKDKTHEFFSQNSKFRQIFTMRLQKFSLEITCYDNFLLESPTFSKRIIFQNSRETKKSIFQKCPNYMPVLKLKLKIDLKEYTPPSLQEIGMLE